MKLLDARAAQATQATSHDESAVAALLQACILPVNKEVQFFAFMSLLQTFSAAVDISMGLYCHCAGVLAWLICWLVVV